ncbi:4Fe-4S dicluster domain-containing protein [Neomoorella humiferrea]|uniref:4Fe-4S ferredoxin-type domain-containing protein n=1 Tax=Neomoorella humiferrea TaxID=676965 RepID=A0A2T0AK19_9FIRM|nr:4Fe-4S dicluster domain-containing protein [Moorella humiferrea]PRR68709.1 hypothetical protein MOHU_26410 [Moorella humiferrea]
MLSDCRHCDACRRVCPVLKLGVPAFPACYETSERSPAVWNCTNCWLCHEACPAGINLWQKKALAQQQCIPPAAIAQGIDNLKATGLVFPFTPELNERRRAYGLEPVKLLDQRKLSLLIS